MATEDDGPEMELTEAIEKRKKWVNVVCEFVRLRTLFIATWNMMSTGCVERADFPVDALCDLKQRRVNGDVVKTMTDVYEVADVVKPAFDDRLAVVVGHCGIFGSSYQQHTNWLEFCHGVVGGNYSFGLITPPLKSKERALHKSQEDYGQSVHMLHDVVRASVVCTTEQQVYDITKRLIEGKEFRVVRIKNRFKNPSPNGYRDIILSVIINDGETASSLEGGFICELQIHHIAVVLHGLKHHSYHFYKYFRTFFGDSVMDSRRLDSKMKILKKMDQIGDDVTRLDDFMDEYLRGAGRVSRDVERLTTYFQLFYRFEEFTIAEKVQLAIINLLRKKNLRVELADALHFMCAYYISRCRFADALPHSREALQISEEEHGLGVPHLETARHLDNLGALYYCQQKLDEALPVIERAYEMHVAVLGENHASSFKAAHTLADVHMDREDFTSARKIYAELLERVSATHGPESPLVALELHSLAGLDEIDGNFAEALDKYTKAATIREKFYGGDHLLVAASRYLMAVVLERLGLVHDALEVHASALQIRWTAYLSLGPDKPDDDLALEEAVAMSLNSSASILLEVGMVAKACRYLEQALKIREKIFSVEINASMPKLQKALKSNSIAKSNRGKKLKVARAVKPSDDVPSAAALSLATARNNLAEALIHLAGRGGTRANNHLQRAQILLDKALTTRVKRFGMKSEVVAETLNNQAVLQDSLQYLAEQQITCAQSHSSHGTIPTVESSITRAMAMAEPKAALNASASASASASAVDISSTVSGQGSISANTVSGPKVLRIGITGRQQSVQAVSLQMKVPNETPETDGRGTGGTLFPPLVPPGSARSTTSSIPSLSSARGGPMPETSSRSLAAFPSQASLKSAPSVKSLPSVRSMASLITARDRDRDRDRDMDRDRDGDRDNGTRGDSKVDASTRRSADAEEDKSNVSLNGMGSARNPLSKVSEESTAPSSSSSVLESVEEFALHSSEDEDPDVPHATELEMQSGAQLDDDLARVDNLMKAAVADVDVGDFEAGVRMCRQAVQLVVAKMGENSWYTAVALTHLGVACEDAEMFVEAEEAFQRALAIVRVIFKTTKHRLVGVALTNLAGALRAQGRPSEAVPLYEEAVKFWVPRSQEEATVWHCLAQCFRALGRLEDASEAVQNAISIRRALLPDEHPEVASAMSSLGLILLDQGMHLRALWVLKQAAEAREKAGNLNPAYATLVNNLAMAFFAMGNMAKAGRFFTLSLELRDRQYGCTSVEVEIALRNLGVVYRVQDIHNYADILLNAAETLHVQVPELRRRMHIGAMMDTRVVDGEAEDGAQGGNKGKGHDGDRKPRSAHAHSNSGSRRNTRHAHHDDEK